jgi:hypothetical protein
MRRIDRACPTVLVVATFLVTVGLASCGSSDAGGTNTVPSAPAAPAATQAAPAQSTVPATAETTVVSPPATEVSIATETVVVTDADVADLEKQLDEIDQLLAGVDADLSQD